MQFIGDFFHRVFPAQLDGFALCGGDLISLDEETKRDLSTFPDRLSTPYIRNSRPVRECVFTLSLGDLLMKEHHAGALSNSPRTPNVLTFAA